MGGTHAVSLTNDAATVSVSAGLRVGQEHRACVPPYCCLSHQTIGCRGIAGSLFCASETRGQRADTSHMMGGQEWSRRHVHSGESEMSVRVSGMCAPGSRPRHRTVARGGGRAGGAAVSRPQRDGGRASGKAGVGSLAPLAPFGNDRSLLALHLTAPLALILLLLQCR